MKSFTFLSLISVTLAAPFLNRRTVSASPASTLITSLLSAKSSVTTLTSAEESTMNIKNGAIFASAAYCPVVNEGSWTCPLCADIPEVELLYETGDGDETPYAYVAYSASLDWLILAHEGTNDDSLESWINDLEFDKVAVDSSLNNGEVSSSAEVHQGFQETYLRTNTWALESIQTALKTYSPSLILVTGHSLGAAISTLTAVYLTINLDTTIPLQQLGFGQPRVGNSAWVTYYQSVMGNNQMRVTNYDDIVPHLPPEIDSYEQPDNEIWITTSGGSTFELCSGDENDSCSDQFLFYSTSPHDGPYLGITVSSDQC